MNHLFSVKRRGAWWRGTLSVNYNFLTFLKILVFLVIIPFLALYYIGKEIWKSLCWIGRNILPVAIWLYFLLLIFWTWLKGLFARKSKNKTLRPRPQTKNSKWGWLLLLLILLIGGALIWRSCDSKKVQEEVPSLVEKTYDTSFDKVIIARAYLDGVQKKVTKNCPRALVGLKFINDKPIKDFNFEGMTYDQSVKVVAENWKPLVLENLSSSVYLTEQKMAVVTLVAMRMGKNGFIRSTFLKKLNEGDITSTTQWLLLQDADGNISKTGPEPKQYFYILRLLWTGDLDIDRLLDMPMFSYKGISTNVMYNDQGKHIWNEGISKRLEKGNFATPREALELE